MGSTASIPSEQFVSVGATLKAGKSSRRFSLCCSFSSFCSSSSFLLPDVAYEQAVAEGKSPDEIKQLLTAAFDTATMGAASTETPGETPPEEAQPTTTEAPAAENVSVDNVDASKEEPVVAIEGDSSVPVDEMKG